MTHAYLPPHVRQNLVDAINDALQERDQARDQARADRDRLRTAWTSARRRANRYRGLAEIRAAVRNRLKAQLDTAVEQRDQARRDASAARAEAEELRRALRSALSSPDEGGVHTTLSHMRKLAGLDDGPARPDLVEPGDEVPALCELADRVAALEERLSPVDERAGVAPERPAPTRYRDRHGDVWERVDPFLYALVEVSGDDTVGAAYSRPLEYVRDTYGPLTLVTNESAGGAE